LEGKREVSYEEGENYADEYDMDYFCEASAKMGYNTNEMFVKAARVLYNEYKKSEGNRAFHSGISAHSFKLNNRLGEKDQQEENIVNNTKSSCRC
jgi:hypothetical protein